MENSRERRGGYRLTISLSLVALHKVSQQFLFAHMAKIEKVCFVRRPLDAFLVSDAARFFGRRVRIRF